MSDHATDGSSHDGDPSHSQFTDGEAAPGYSTNKSDLYNNIGSQFSDSQHQYAQRDQAGRPDRGDVYEHRGYTERYERPQRNPRQQQRKLNQDVQALEHRRRLEEQRRAELQLHEQRRQHEELLAARRNANREQYHLKDPKSDDENHQSRRRKPR